MRAAWTRGRLLRGASLPVCAALLLAGCASMPSSGEVRKVDDSQHADSDAQVRVGAKLPHAGESASDIVGGFMEATTSSEADFATAKKYLTKGAAARWNGNQKITVLSGGGPPSQDATTGDAKNQTQFTLSGTEVAVVDAQHAYHQPEQSTFQTAFHLTMENNQWRIDALDDGLVLFESDFQRMYRSVNMYYYASLGTDAVRQGASKQTLVADPMYLRQETDADPLQTTVSALFDGPTRWLSPVASSAAPAGARLYSNGSDHGVTLDDSQHLRVRLDRTADHLSGAQCTRLAGQLFATVQAQASAKLASAQVQRADGTTACTVGAQDAPTSGPQEPTGFPMQQYFIGQQNQLMGLTSGATNATAVNGPLGGSKADLGSVAVRHDESVAAGVKTNGRQLVVGSLLDNRPLGSPVYTSDAREAKNGLSAPSWDGLGDLWVADRATSVSKLLIMRDGTGKASEVPVDGLGGRVESVRVASDGVRIALVVNEGGNKRLELGRIDRGGTLNDPQFKVSGLKPLTLPGENVTSVSWAGASRLVVLGTESGVQQIQYVNTDGSSAPPLEGISSASSVAASEDQREPLLASFDGDVYRLVPSDANWKRLTPKGASPVYPG